MTENGKGQQDNTLSILDQQLKNVEAENQFLSFYIGEEEYAVEVLLVQEIIRYNKPTRIPNAPSVVAGVINFRGKVIPIIEMREKFQLPSRDYDAFTIIIVLQVDGKTMGMLVDSVSDVLSFADGQVQEADEDLSTDVNTDFIRGLGKMENGRLIQILDPVRLLAMGDLIQGDELKASDGEKTTKE